MEKAFRIITIAVFCLVLLAPFSQEHLHLLEFQSLTENRLKKPRPTDWKSLFKLGGSFAQHYEEYFNDTYGFRDLLIRIKNQLDFSLFRQGEKVIIGRDNWLFYKSVVEAEEIYIEQAHPEDFERMYTRLLQLNRLLASRGIKLVILPCPMNNTIYPEMLPPSAPRRPNPTGFARYTEFLWQHSEIESLDAVALLEKLKQTIPVYHQTDFHWNDPAGARVAQQLVNKLGRLSGKGDLWDQPIEIRKEKFTYGGENHALGLLWPLREEGLFLNTAHLRTGRGEYRYSPDGREWTYQTKLADTAKLIPPTVMIGDSFGDAFERAGFANYFSYLRKSFVFDLKKEISHLPEGTRFVVLQHIEPFLNALLGDVIWPEEVLSNSSPTR
jgi:alginate O-acetyltransferase complex protein AlgJ